MTIAIERMEHQKCMVDTISMKLLTIIWGISSKILPEYILLRNKITLKR